MSRSSGSGQRTTLKLVLDLLLFVVFVIATAPRFSGLALHEWGSFVLAGAVVYHLLLNWSWIVQITLRLFSAKTPWRTRVNYVLNTLFFIAFTVIIVTGLVISEVALPWLGIDLHRSGPWLALHGQATEISMIILGLHVALHWSWIVSAFKRLVTPRRALPVRAVAQNTQSEVQ
jgi:hypothetical protein